MRILYILTAPQMAIFLRGQITHLRSCGFQVMICTPELTPLIASISEEEGAHILCVPLKREIAPLADLISFISLGLTIRRVLPDLTVTLGPKAGLLGGLASLAAGTSARVQTKWGLRLETTRGALRVVLWLAERLSALSANLTLFDSKSAQEKAIKLGIVTTTNSILIGNGSANGIDYDRFERTALNLAGGVAFRKQYGVPQNAPLIGFVGRIGKDKGLREMLEAWLIVIKDRPDAHLMLVGSDECRAPEEKLWLRQLSEAPNVSIVGQKSGLERIFSAFDILLLPSHREGFGVVVLEAAAAGIPTVAFDVTGVRDAVVSGKTGLLANFPDSFELSQHILYYLSNEHVRLNHGNAARNRAIKEFSRSIVWRGYYDTYMRLIEPNRLSKITMWKNCR